MSHPRKQLLLGKGNLSVSPVPFHNALSSFWLPTHWKNREICSHGHLHIQKITSADTQQDNMWWSLNPPTAQTASFPAIWYKGKRIFVRFKLSKIWTFSKERLSLHTDKEKRPPFHISTLPLQLLQGEQCRTAGKKKKIFLTKLFIYQVKQGWNSTEVWKLYIYSWLYQSYSHTTAPLLTLCWHG